MLLIYKIIGETKHHRSLLYEFVAWLVPPEISVKFMASSVQNNIMWLTGNVLLTVCKSDINRPFVILTHWPLVKPYGAITLSTMVLVTTDQAITWTIISCQWNA